MREKPLPFYISHFIFSVIHQPKLPHFALQVYLKIMPSVLIILV